MNRTSRLVLPREMLAMDPSALHRGADGFFFLVGSNVTPNARRGDVAIVTIRGPLEHHKGSDADNYESIVERYEAALAGMSSDGEQLEVPKAVIFSIDSVGGAVSGLNETIAKIRKLAAASKIPLIAYVNELAASAAYAMCCACDVVYGPASCIAGSIGTISTMISVAEQDKKSGIDVRLITSGARKADGHIHTPITDAAIAAESDRVEKLARAFYELVSERRGKSPDKWRALNAAIFLGEDAKKRGLLDAVRSLDDVVSEFGTPSKSLKEKGNETDRRMADAGSVKSLLDEVAQRASVSSVAHDGSKQEAPMPVGLDILIRKTEAALAATDLSPTKKARLERDLATYKYAAAKAEGGEDDDEDDEEEDDKAAKAAKKAETSKKRADAAQHKARADEFRRKAAEADEEARKCMADDEEDEKKSEASISPGHVVASAPDVVDMAIANRLSALETERAEEKRMNSIAAALAERRITPHEAKELKGQSSEVVAAILKMRKGSIVHSESASVVLEPEGGSGAPTSADTARINQINESIRMMGITDPKTVEKLREDMLKAGRQLTEQTNGVPRY